MRWLETLGAVALLACGFVMAGCSPDIDDRAGGTDGAPAVSTDLAGTNWRLVQFESSDDAIGVVVPPNVERYTLDFMADGTLAMQLDCNRGSARWEATPSGDTGGSLEVSPGMMTRAFCGEDALDSQIARDLGFVRSYTMRDGRLHLALMADGGIYSWAPQ